MFELPPEDELSSQIGQHRQSWLEECRERDYVIAGGGPTALVAGIYLQYENHSTLIMTEADHVGGRLTWDYGPVPIFAPADELLYDLDYPVDSEPVLWLDRNLLLMFLVRTFYDEGGAILTGGYFNKYPYESDSGYQVEITLSDRPEVFAARDVITTLAKFNRESRIQEARTSLEKLVLNTLRRRDGVVQAGVQALPDAERSTGPPPESGLLLSGRKAAELVLEEDV